MSRVFGDSEGLNKVTLNTIAHPNRIHAVPDRITQVLANLVANALRYTPAAATVTLSAESAESAVLLCVHDTAAASPLST